MISQLCFCISCDVNKLCTLFSDKVRDTQASNKPYVHRLFPEKDDSDTDEATDNGNSTQQQ